MGSMKLRRGWLSWLESHEMDVSVDVRFDYTFEFNACCGSIDFPQTQGFDSTSRMLESPLPLNWLEA
jgi:hypothetical protein